MPVSRSTSNTRSAGTRSHCDTAPRRDAKPSCQRDPASAFLFKIILENTHASIVAQL